MPQPTEHRGGISLISPGRQDDDARLPRFRLTILFVAVSVVLVAAAWFAVGRISTRIGEESVVGIGEELAEADAGLIGGAFSRILANLGLDSSADALKLLEQFSDGESDPLVVLMQFVGDENLDELLAPIDFYQMSLHGPDGTILWSSGASEGIEHSKHAIAMGLEGGSQTKLVRGVEIHEEESANSIDLLESFVPLEPDAGGTPGLVFHLSRDVTELVAEKVSETRSTILRATMSVLGAVLFVLGGFVVLADLRMTKISNRLIDEQSRLRRLGDIEREELERLDVAKNEFLSGLSHELKTPLAAMLGFTQILSRNRGDRLDESDLAKLEVIGRNGRRLDTLIGDLLDLSKIESKQIALDTNPIAVDDLIDEVSASFETILLAKNQSLDVDVNHVPAWIPGDRGRLVQVLTNLLSNASKYSQPETNIVARCEIADARLVLSIIDEGPGIKQEDQSRLFDLFYRTPEAEESSTPGTGIGLYISKKIIELHNGKIFVKSSPGSGTTFVVELPDVRFSPPEATVEGPRFTNRLTDMDKAS